MKNTTKLFSVIAASALAALPVALAQSAPSAPPAPPAAPPPPPAAPMAAPGRNAGPGGPGANPGRGNFPQLTPGTDIPTQEEMATVNAALKKLLGSDPAVKAIIDKYPNWNPLTAGFGNNRGNNGNRRNGGGGNAGGGAPGA